MSFTASFRTKFDAEDRLPAGLVAAPQWYSRSILGGCLAADIQVDGDLILLWSLLNRLGQRVVIFNNVMHPVWWGVVEEVLISRGGLMDGLSVRRMYNRIRIAFSYEQMGEQVAGMTDWGQNNASVQALGFVRELLETTEIDATPALAIAKRDTLLNRVGIPAAISEEGGGSGPASAIIRCTGDINTLAWRYYDQPSGMVAHEDGNGADQPLGLAVQSIAWGFNRAGRIYDMAGRLNNFPTNVKINISGSASNDGTRTVKNVDSRPLRSYTSDTISFDFADDIYDHTHAEFGFIEVDDYIHVSGAAHPNNNGYKQVKTAGGGHLEVRPQNNFASGSPPYPTTTIVRGNYIETEETGTTELPSDDRTVTIFAHGLEIAQAFRINPPAGNWTLNRVELRVKKVGAPVDGVMVDICSYNAGIPGAVLQSASVPASDMANEFATESFQFTNTLILQQDVTYFLRIKRTGAFDVANYFVIEVDEKVGYTDGSFMLWTGSAWALRTPNASLLFRVLGAWETQKQITELVNRAGQFVNKLDIRTSTGVFSNQFRDGQQLAYDEFMALLDAGTSSGNTLIADVTIEHILRLTQSIQVEVTDAIQQTADGRYLDSHGRPLAEGVLPVGRWVTRGDIPSAIAAMYRMSPRLVQEAEYDCRANRIRRMRFLGDPDPAEILGL